MPANFDKCVRNGGRVRTVSGPNKEHGLSRGQYVRYCYLDGQSYRGEVMSKKTTKAFRLFTQTIKAVKADDGQRFLVGTASSNNIDRDDDRMSEAALQTMKSTAEANLTLFTNHEYRVPEDLFGSCVEAKIIANKDADPIRLKNEDGEEDVATFYPSKLEVKIKVVSDKVNPRAGQIFRAIEEGVNLGFSIGGKVKKLLKVKDAVTDKLHSLIDAIELYEISLVGIPANADAMNVAIAKSLKGIDIKEADTEEIEKIVEKTKRHEEPQYNLEGVHKFLLQELKKAYNEYGNYYESEEEKTEREVKDLNYAKAEAENVLMKAGIKVSVDTNDEDECHLRSHSWAMDSMMRAGSDTSLISKHIQKHLKRLKDKLSATNSETNE